MAAPHKPYILGLISASNRPVGPWSMWMRRDTRTGCVGLASVVLTAAWAARVRLPAARTNPKTSSVGRLVSSAVNSGVAAGD